MAPTFKRWTISTSSRIATTATTPRHRHNSELDSIHHHKTGRNPHQTASTNSTISVFSSTLLDTVLGDRDRRVSSVVRELIRRRMRTLDPTAAAMKKTISMISPTPSKSPSRKQSSVKSRCDGRNPCSSDGRSCEYPLWLNTASLFRSLQSCVLDKPGASFNSAGSMILSKSSLHTVCVRCSCAEGFGSLRYCSSMSGSILATHSRWGSGMLSSMMRGGILSRFVRRSVREKS